MESFTDSGLVCEENFAPLMILELTGDESLVQLSHLPRTWNFLRGQPLFNETFPDDLDQTALALSILKTDPDVLSDVMDEMLEWRNDDGILLTYFDQTRARGDHVVNVNILTLFYAHGFGRELDEALAWVREVLLRRQHLKGSRYYSSLPTSSSTSSVDSSRARTTRTFTNDSTRYLQSASRSASGSWAIRWSSHVEGVLCDSIGITNQVDMRSLLSQQCEDGGWEAGWLYRFGETGIRIGNRGVSTALAIKAIESAKHPAASSFGVSEFEGEMVVSRL